MTEVAFFLPSYQEVIGQIYRVLSPGGLAFISFWSKYYRLLQMVKGRSWETAEMILKDSEGFWKGDSVWLSGQTVERIQELLTNTGFSGIKFRGIGISSGIEGDPLAMIARPSLLSKGEQQRLMMIETALGEAYADCGRYILAIAIKRENGVGQ